MRRRTFLKSTAALAATAAGGPVILGATNKAGTKNPVIGVPGHLYECLHNWGTLPGELEWQTTHNVAVDGEGLVYVTHQGFPKKKGLDTVMVFDPKGKFVRSFGKEWHGGGHGIDVRKDGNEEFLYLTNTWTQKIKACKTTLKGEMVWEKGRPEIKEYEDSKKGYSPTNVAFCPDGSFFIGDGYGSHFIMKYDKDGKMTKVFGGPGAGPGKFQTPHGNWVDTRGDKPTLVVCDRANARLQTFDLDGNFLSATEKAAVVLYPAHIDVRGDVLMVADLHARVTLLGKDGKVITHLGEDPEWRAKVVGSRDKGKGPPVRNNPKACPDGKFIHPHDACFDKDGNIYVVEWVEGGRVTFLKKVG